MTTVIDFTKKNNRQCGGCSLCCRLLPVQELEKRSGTKCVHQSRKGCSIYHKADFPMSCALWSCRWLNGDDTEKLRRPDRSHYVIDCMPDVVTIRQGDDGEPIYVEAIQVWVDPKYPQAWRDPALRAFLERRGEENKCAIIRFNGSDGFILFPPSLSGDGQWHEERGTVTPELSPHERIKRLESAHGPRVVQDESD